MVVTALIEFVLRDGHGSIIHLAIMSRMASLQNVPIWYSDVGVNGSTLTRPINRFRAHATGRRVFAIAGADSLEPPVTHVILLFSPRAARNLLIF